jgi:hypothetical protein
MVAKRRPNWTAFDLLMTKAADFLCSDGGLDRSAVARAMSIRIDELRAAAKRLRPFDPKAKPSAGPQVFIVKALASPHVQALAGTMQEMDTRLALTGVARVTFVSLSLAWNYVWQDAQEVGIDLGPLTPSTFEE